MELREYQREAIDSIFDYFSRRTGNPVCCCPTGSGKSVIQSAFITEAIQRYKNTRILCLTHVKELIEQNYNAFCRYDQNNRYIAGINSASLHRRDLNKQVLFAGIQSVRNKSHKIGHVDLILIDECHMINTKDTGTYRTLINELMDINPSLKCVGLTATPYRLDGGAICTGEQALFTSICYDIDILMLIENGYLCDITTQSGVAHYDTSGVSRARDDFNQKSLAAMIARSSSATAAACQEIIEHGRDRNSWLVFTTGVKHANEVADILSVNDIGRVEVITGDTEVSKRTQWLNEFKEGKIRCIVNVNVLTTGFDAPCIDMVAMLRPTQSPVLYTQSVGRGLRLHQSKKNCLFLDFGQNIERFGPLNKIKPPPTPGKGKGGAAVKKSCPNCQFECFAAVRECEECGFEFPEPEIKLYKKSNMSILERDPDIGEDGKKWEDVGIVTYNEHKKKEGIRSMRVDYHSPIGLRIVSSWICLDHKGYAKMKADLWVSEHITREIKEIPYTVDDALKVSDLFKVPKRVLVDYFKEFPYVVDLEFEEAEKDLDTCAVDSDNENNNEDDEDQFWDDDLLPF